MGGGRRFTCSLDRPSWRWSGKTVSGGRGACRPRAPATCDHCRVETFEVLDPVERLAALQEVTLFADLAPADLERIADVTSQRCYEPGELVFAEGAPGDEMLVVIEGGAHAGRPIAGNPVHLVELGVGSLVGELALLRRQPRLTDVVAGDDGMTALVIEAATLESVLEERPGVAHSMLAALADKLAESSLLDM